MENKEENRTKILLTRLKPGELKSLEKRFEKTRFRNLSEYIRSVLFDKPITVFYRDKSMDEMMEEMILLRKELNAIGNNLNQTVRNINALHGKEDPRLWLNLLSIIDSSIMPSIGQIKGQMNKFSDVWSQKLRAENL